MFFSKLELWLTPLKLGEHQVAARRDHETFRLTLRKKRNSTRALIFHYLHARIGTYTNTGLVGLVYGV